VASERGAGEAGLLGELLRAALDLPAERPPDAGRALLAARLGLVLAEEVWAGVAVALGWAGAGDDDVRAAAAAPGVLRTSAARAIGAGLRQRAVEELVVVAIDDAHLADPASLDGLEQATQQGGTCRLAVCVAVRPALLAGRPGWGDRAGVHQRVDVAPLDDESAAALLRRLLAPAENLPPPPPAPPP